MRIETASAIGFHPDGGATLIGNEKNMRQYLAVVAVAMIALAIGFSLSTREVKAWKHEQEGDFRDEYSAISFVQSEDGEGWLIVGEYFKNGRDPSPYHLTQISLMGPCPSKGIPVVKMWIDGWRKDIPAVAVDNEGFCVVRLFRRDFDLHESLNNADLIKRLNSGITMQTKWLDGPGESRLFKFDISGETQFIQGEAVK